MFESGAILLKRPGSLPEPPPLTDEQYATRYDDFVARMNGEWADPELLLHLDRTSEPIEAHAYVDVDRLLTWAEEQPLGVATLGTLDGIDRERLTKSQQLRLIRIFQRLEARITGLKLEQIADFAGPEEDPHDPEDGIIARRGMPAFVDCEIAAATRTSTVGAQRTVKLARDLKHRLTRTLQMLLAGEIGYGHAMQVADVSSELDVDECAQFEELALKRATDQTPGELRQTARRAVARVAADKLKRREKAARAGTCVDTWHGDDGHGGVDARGPSVGISLIESWLEAYARSAKAAGDPRTLSVLRFAGLVAACEAALSGQTMGSAPTEHGRPVTVNVTIDLPTFLGLTDHPGEILGTGAIIPAEVIRELIPDAKLRRLITDPMTGALLDYGRETYRVRADLAAFTTFRDVTSTAPGSTVPAGRGDKDHATAWDDGGETNRDNVHSVNRRWHRAKTLGGWTVTQNGDGSWTWTGPHGLTSRTHPHDYRLGP
jgi:hypothetical protein